eukprot:COSAG06_NODE_21155_length_768_cov_2.029940_1_plen_137_part_01
MAQCQRLAAMVAQESGVAVGSPPEPVQCVVRLIVGFPGYQGGQRFGVRGLWRCGSIIPVLAIAPRECDCHWLRERGPDGGPGLADLRGRHDMVCTNTSGDKLRRHNSVLVAIRASLSLLNIYSSMCNVLGIAQRGNQ